MEISQSLGSDTVDTADFVVTSVLRNEWESTQTMMPANEELFWGPSYGHMSKWNSLCSGHERKVGGAHV